jgi:hypothetical protein
MEDAGAALTLSIRTQLRYRSQNCWLLADGELNANEIFLSTCHYFIRCEKGRAPANLQSIERRQSHVELFQHL